MSARTNTCLRCTNDSNVLDAYVEVDLGSDRSEIWVTARVWIDPSSLSNWAGSQSPFFIRALAMDNSQLDAVSVATSGLWRLATGTPTGTPLDTEWFTFEYHYKDGVTTQLYINGTLTVNGSAPTGTVKTVRYGQDLNSLATPSIVYWDDVKIGPTRGSSSYYSEDFEDWGSSFPAHPTGGSGEAYYSVDPAARPSVWRAEFPFVPGGLAVPTVRNGHMYKWMGEAITGTDEPVWPTDGSSVADGGSTWLDLGASFSPDATTEWAPETTYGETSIVTPPTPNGRLYILYPTYVGESGVWPHGGQANPWTAPYNGTDDNPAGPEWPFGGLDPRDFSYSPLDGVVYWQDIGPELAPLPPSPPDPPTLTSVEYDDRSITLAYTPNDPGDAPITGYRIYRSTVSGDEELLADAPALPLTYVDFALDGSETYYYKVAAVNENGESDLSNELSATTPTFLIALVAAGFNPADGEYEIAKEWAPLDGGRRGSFNANDGSDTALRAQVATIRITQTGPSARTEIYAVDLTVIPQDPGLEGEDG